MKIGVIGAGPMGGILSSLLIKSGHEVFIIDVQKDIISKVKSEGFKIKGPMVSKLGGEFSAKPNGAFFDPSDAGKVDFWFVCVKVTVLKSVVSSLYKAYVPGTAVISFQNGIDPEDMLGEVAGRDNTLRAVLNFGGNTIEPGVYSLNWFNPPNYLGALTKTGQMHSEKVVKLLNDAGLTTNVVDDIKKYSFQKAALNATLCPVCTLTGLRMGEAMAFQETRDLVVQILKESFTVGEKMGWKFEKTMDDCLKYLEGGGLHFPSMAEDIKCGRKTEIAFMNGKICEYGRKLGIPTPYNDAMTLTILGREKSLEKSK